MAMYARMMKISHTRLYTGGKRPRFKASAASKTPKIEAPVEKSVEALASASKAPRIEAPTEKSVEAPASASKAPKIEAAAEKSVEASASASKTLDEQVLLLSGGIVDKKASAMQLMDAKQYMWDTLQGRTKQQPPRHFIAQQEAGGEFPSPVVRLDSLQKQVNEIQPHLQVLEDWIGYSKPELYGVLGINRFTAAAEILDVAASFLSYFTREAIQKQGVLDELVDCGPRGPRKLKPYSSYDKAAITYGSLWWFVFNKEASGKSLSEVWHDFEIQGQVLLLDWDRKRSSACKEGMHVICKQVIQAAEEELAKDMDSCQQQCDIRKCIGFYLSCIKPRQNTGVHTMGILNTFQWASSSSTTATFSVDRLDIQLKKMEMSELQQKIRVLFDIHGHAHTIPEFKYIADTFYPLLNWYATKLGIKVFEICGRNKLVDEDASVTYEFVEGKWMRDGLQDQHWSLLSWYSIWDLSDLLSIFGAFASCSKNNFTGFGLLNTQAVQRPDLQS
ncbi:hypothetical protein SELMODRAFT_427991 [Selaginella moellendorffii]|uniref:Uncharacterized protein n=1 Tax=Selaginella moellendorffii TaxID=88036 RepID=D8T1C8_SELML|nr:hypothetical protein SELMODRAFT_427991 [Selaginella moellendorffii]